MTMKEWYLRRRLRRAGFALLKADERAAVAEERLREAAKAFGEYQSTTGAPLKRLWPAGESR